MSIAIAPVDAMDARERPTRARINTPPIIADTPNRKVIQRKKEISMRKDITILQVLFVRTLSGGCAFFDGWLLLMISVESGSAVVVVTGDGSAATVVERLMVKVVEVVSITS